MNPFLVLAHDDFPGLLDKILKGLIGEIEDHQSQKDGYAKNERKVLFYK